MNLFTRVSIFILLICGLLQFRQVHAAEYEISLFRDYVNQYQMAEQRFQSAPYGSPAQAQADMERKAQAQNAKNIIRAPNTFMQMTAARNESLLLEFIQSLQQSQYGSLRQSIFDIASQAASSAYRLNAVAEIQREPDYKVALQMSLTANQKFLNATYNSIQAQAYDHVRNQGFQISIRKLQEYAQFGLQDFRQAESLFLYYHQQFNGTQFNTLPANYYDQGRMVLKNRTFAIFKIQEMMMNYAQLQLIQAEYNQKFLNASYNSLPAQLFLSIRDEARIRLSQLQPPSTCDIRQGANASGQILWRVMTRSGAIIATVFTLQEAQQIAMNDLRCR